MSEDSELSPDPADQPDEAPIQESDTAEESGRFMIDLPEGDSGEKLISLCRRKWEPDDEPLMIGTFAALVKDPSFALAENELREIRGRHSNFFNKKLFDCASEFSNEAEQGDKLAVLEHLGVGDDWAIASLCHWITGRSIVKCAEILADAIEYSPSDEHAVEDLEFSLAELADAGEHQRVEVRPEIKIPALKILPRVSLCSRTLLVLAHCADPSREDSVDVRQVAIELLGLHACATEDHRTIRRLGESCLASFEPKSELRRLALSCLEEYATKGSRLSREPDLSILGAYLERLFEPKERVFTSEESEAANKESVIDNRAAAVDFLTKLVEGSEDERSLRLLGEQALPAGEPAAELRHRALGLLHRYGLESGKLTRVENPNITLSYLIKTLNDRSNGVFEFALGFVKQLLALDTWEGFVRHLAESGMLELFDTLSKIIRQGGTRATATIQLFQDETLLHAHLLRDDRLLEFQRSISSQDYERPVVEALKAGTANLIGLLTEHILDSEADYVEAVDSVITIGVLANRQKGPIREFLRRDAFDRFTSQGRILENSVLTYEELFEFENAVNPLFYDQFRCGGGIDCEIPSSVSRSGPCVGYHDGRWHFVSPSQFASECTVSQYKTHVCSGFPSGKRCHQQFKSKHVNSWGGGGSFTRAGMPAYSASAFLKRSPTPPILTTKGKDLLEKLMGSPNSHLWKQDMVDLSSLEELRKTVVTLDDEIQKFQVAYQKKIRFDKDRCFKLMYGQEEPDRRLIKALLDAMKVLSVGDVETQEYLIGVFGKDEESFHWHEPTRIWIIETLAEITREERLPKYGHETVQEWLSVVEGREGKGESPAVVAASLTARKKLRNSNQADPGAEMMLAPKEEQPADAVGIV